MRSARRRFLQRAAAALSAPFLTDVARAQIYPTRPVRIIVGYPAGGVSDILARLVAERLSERLGEPFIVENRPGAGGNIGTEFVVRASPDGYTLLLIGVANAINVSLYGDLNFNFIHDIAPIAIIDHGPLVMEVNPSIPVNSVPEFIAYAKANPGKINMASAGTGGASHVAGELFKMMTDIDLVHIPYHGSTPALTDLVAGQVHIMFDNVASSISLIRAGRLRPLAVATKVRSQTLPDIPAVGEFVPGYEANAWNGVGAPKNIPSAIIQSLNREINAMLAEAKLQAQLADLGGTPVLASPVEFGAFIVEDAEKWAKVVKFAGIKPT
jgi:tripartite-type tricarboxylate transporter receptor subunit TctC